MCKGPAEPLLLVTLAGEELEVADVVAAGGAAAGGLVIPLVPLGVAAL